MSTLTPVTKCPKCGSNAINVSAFERAQENDQLTCPSCGHHAAKKLFVADLMNEATKMFQDALKGVPGFKPR